MISLFFAKLDIFFAAPVTVSGCGALRERSFFFLPNWWQYLDVKKDELGQCAPVAQFPGDIWLIGLAIVEMLIMLAGFLAVVSIIIAGIELIASEGNSEKAVNARNRIINSLKGMALAVIAVAAVAVIGNQIAGDGGSLPRTAANQSTLNTMLNMVFVVAGALAFLFMVIAGFRFVISRGDPNKIAESRKQIAYAAIGLIVVASAAAIVNLVLKRI